MYGNKQGEPMNTERFETMIALMKSQLDFPKDAHGNYIGQYAIYENDEHGEVIYFEDINSNPVIFDEIEDAVSYVRITRQLPVYSEDDLHEVGIYLQYIE